MGYHKIVSRNHRKIRFFKTTQYLYPVELFGLVCDFHFCRGVSNHPTDHPSNSHHRHLCPFHPISVQIHLFCRLLWHFPPHNHPCISLYDTFHVVWRKKKQLHLGVHQRCFDVFRFDCHRFKRIHSPPLRYHTINA